jgi:hypothetical protein
MENTYLIKAVGAISSSIVNRSDFFFALRSMDQTGVIIIDGVPYDVSTLDTSEGNNAASANVQQLDSIVADTYVSHGLVTPYVLTPGSSIVIQINITNTGAAMTINPDGLGAIPVKINGADPAANTFIGGQTYVMNYSGTVFTPPSPSIVPSLIPKDVIDLSTNPPYPPSNFGDVLRVTVAGKIGGGSGVSANVDDQITCWFKNTGGSQAAVGSYFTVQPSITDVNALIGVESAARSAADMTLSGRISALEGAVDFSQGGNSFGANAILGTNDNFDLIFKTDNTEIGRILRGGNWGIGTNNPHGALDVRVSLVSDNFGILGGTGTAFRINDNSLTGTLDGTGFASVIQGIHQMILNGNDAGNVVRLKVIGSASSGVSTIEIKDTTDTNYFMAINDVGRIGIGVKAANASCIIDIVSTLGFGFPAMNTTTKNAIPSPRVGCSVYDTTLLAISTWNGTTWA